MTLPPTQAKSLPAQSLKTQPDQTQLTQITIYPVKSTAPVTLSRSAVTDTGLAFDRQFVLCDDNGKFITARTKPRLLGVKTALLPEGILLTAPGVEPLHLEYAAFSGPYHSIRVWQDSIDAVCCGDNAAQWFSEYLQGPCKLYFFGPQSSRPVNRRPGNQVAFADGYPLLLISEASLSDLNRRCKSTVRMEQMRPNLVVSNCEPYAEDGWQRIRIGEIEFDIVKPCGRCILTTTDPETLERNADREPLSVLKQYRRGADGEAHFGQNLVPLNHGIISLNDPVEVLETCKAQTYGQ
ncbi:MOSC domain-containing protein [Amphritea pacifica]|uniref:MOSC domain-containing protein n=1 Tax=Amphritea pacifica TaxID=2811233 RepID=A0ABS2W788_9GAMM|nr:MOSC domain-containing protein [Amphritea pacifica]MBN0987433.1 MOSC domain-containing protein [Amphritea pacifica]